jgi:cardiolipin synthase
MIQVTQSTEFSVMILCAHRFAVTSLRVCHRSPFLLPNFNRSLRVSSFNQSIVCFSSPTNTKTNTNRENILTVPNVITSIRIAFSPFVGYLIASGDYQHAVISLIAVSVKDALDGWIARRFNQKTVLGSILDPLADKVLMTTLVISLSYSGLLP